MNTITDDCWDALKLMHEALGDEYLDTMSLYGIKRPPAVSWETVGYRTAAFVYWENGDDSVEREEVVGFPPDMLACEVSRRVLVRLGGSGN